jgi:hypothetical protein
LNQFGSIGFRLWKPNWNFFVIFNQLIWFFFCFFGLIGLSIFLLIFKLNYTPPSGLWNSALVGLVHVDICESGSLNILRLDGSSSMGQNPDRKHYQMLVYIPNVKALYFIRGSLSHDNLSGCIPKSISRINKLGVLRLEFN